MQQLPSIAVVGSASTLRQQAPPLYSLFPLPLLDAVPMSRDLSPSQIAHHLFGAAPAPAAARSWTIDTKYYTAHAQALEYCSVAESDAPNVRRP